MLSAPKASHAIYCMVVDKGYILIEVIKNMLNAGSEPKDIAIALGITEEKVIKMIDKNNLAN